MGGWQQCRLVSHPVPSRPITSHLNYLDLFSLSSQNNNNNNNNKQRSNGKPSLRQVFLIFLKFYLQKIYK